MTSKNKQVSLMLLFILGAILLLKPCMCHESTTVDIESESSSLQDNTDENTVTEPLTKPTSADKYRLRFSQYRALQAQVMQSVFKKVERKDLSGLLSTMFTNLFKITLEAKANLTKAGYVAGDDFPEDTNTKETLSKVFENAFMFADLLLQRPKAVHAVYDEHKDWVETLAWSYHVCSNSGVFNLAEQQYLDLMAKEAGILPKDESFENPYVDDSEKPRKKFEDPKPKEKKKPKKVKRGPKLSHTEL